MAVNSWLKSPLERRSSNETKQYGVDAQNTNRTTAILNITKPEIKWALDLGEGVSVPYYHQMEH